MHKLHKQHGVALLSGRANRSAKLGWQKESTRPAKSYCQPMMRFIFILQVDLFANWLYYYYNCYYLSVAPQHAGKLLRAGCVSQPKHT